MGTPQDFSNRGPFMPFNEEDLLNYGPSWSSYGMESQFQRVVMPGRFITVCGEELHLPNMHTQGSYDPMERYLLEQPSVPGLLHTDIGRPTGASSPYPYQRTSLSYAPQPQYPNPTIFPRGASPGATSSSRSQSLSPHDEVRSLHHVQHYAYETPDSGYSNFPYPEQPESYACKTYPGETVFGGGSCIALPDIQGVPDQPLEEPKTELKFEFYAIKPEVEYNSCGDDDAVGEPVTDVDSAHYTQDDGSESDYKPRSRSNNKRGRKRTFSQTSHSSISKHRVTKKRDGPQARNARDTSQGNRSRRPRRATINTAAAIAKSTVDMARPFPCPLAIYGCASTFSSKNEWKRHVGTQHIRLGFWRCDLCPPSHDPAQTATYYNDFNRKDLFTQHLRRMHSSSADESKNNTTIVSAHNGGLLPPVNENTVVEHQHRCYEVLRAPPPNSSCLFCSRNFSGNGSWDERMEHVGRHLEKDSKGLVDLASWREDPVLQKWLEKEGLIERAGDKGWKLGDGTPKDDDSDNTDDDEDADAECEDDD